MIEDCDDTRPPDGADVRGWPRSFADVRALFRAGHFDFDGDRWCPTGDCDGPDA